MTTNLFNTCIKKKLNVVVNNLLYYYNVINKNTNSDNYNYKLCTRM